MWQSDMNMLIRILGHTRPDNREVFLFIATWAAGVDKSSTTGVQVFVSYKALQQFHL
jgi:hypothetical protein